MARKIWEYNRLYDILRYYVDCCTRLQFSKVTMSGLEKIPASGAVILAPNHVAALMDPLIMLLTGHRSIGFGARSDIFMKPTVAKILNWLRILPLARERNGLQEVAKNFETMDDIVDCLRHEVPFCMYSEGTHRPERGMLPVKKGIFRFARKAAEDLGQPVYVVPIGVDYEYFFRCMGKVTLQVGEPIEVSSYFEAHKDEPDAETYKSLCDILHTRVVDLLDSVPERKHNLKPLRFLALLLVLPVWFALAVLSLPIWLPSRIILSRMEDKAWTQTVYYAVRLLLPVCWPFFYGFGWLSNKYVDLINDYR